MIKVITYGTYDLLHHGHIRLLERAKALGDYLIVGVTTDDFDKSRGKINVQQSLMERIEAVRATGIADEIIIEEYEGQKIDDIKRYDIDIFTVGSDWEGKFDYLNEFCRVIYLPRTEGISSSEIRLRKEKVRLGLVGEIELLQKIYRESQFVNDIETVAVYTQNPNLNIADVQYVKSYMELFNLIDAIYIASPPKIHFEQIKAALENGKHVLCESPIAISTQESLELFDIAKRNNCVLMDSLKTAYSTAYARLLLLVKSGKIGDVYSVDATCTSLMALSDNSWNSLCYWGPSALLPIFNILGTKYKEKTIVSGFDREGKDIFTKISIIYDHAVASAKVGDGVKSEGELVISGTKGYIYVPAPWWKTDYFEVRFEDPSKNQRFFYQLEGEGLRFELVAFAKAIQNGKISSYIEREVSTAISSMIGDFYKRIDFVEI